MRSAWSNAGSEFTAGEVEIAEAPPDSSPFHPLPRVRNGTQGKWELRHWRRKKEAPNVIRIPGKTGSPPPLSSHFERKIPVSRKRVKGGEGRDIRSFLLSGRVAPPPKEVSWVP